MDSQNKTHPVRDTKVKTVKSIEDSFDAVPYCKGATLVKMINQYMGEENFKLAIRRYLKLHSYNNTNEIDLWNSLEWANSSYVKDFASSWLDKPGFPQLTVNFADGGDRQQIEVKQKRFTMCSNTRTIKQRWLIPVSMLVSGQAGHKEVVKFEMDVGPDGKLVSLPKWFNPDAGHWLKLNVDFGGFYRVQYDENLLKFLEKPIRTQEMT